jgi:hypothetical protein
LVALETPYMLLKCIPSTPYHQKPILMYLLKFELKSPPVIFEGPISKKRKKSITVLLSFLFEISPSAPERISNFEIMLLVRCHQ